MTNIYTYTVDHGKESPSIEADMNINGGNLSGIMFDDALLKLEKAEEFLNSLAESTEDAATQFAIEDFLRSY